MKSGNSDGVAIGTNLTHPKIGVSDKGQNKGAMRTKSQTLVARGNLSIIVPDEIFESPTGHSWLINTLRVADRLHRPTQVRYEDLRQVSNVATPEEIFQAVETVNGPQV